MDTPQTYISPFKAKAEAALQAIRESVAKDGGDKSKKSSKRERTK